jgi:hypothetical protein
MVALASNPLHCHDFVPLLTINASFAFMGGRSARRRGFRLGLGEVQARPQVDALKLLY